MMKDFSGTEKEPKFKYRTGMEKDSVLNNSLILEEDREELEKVAVKLRDIVKKGFIQVFINSLHYQIYSHQYRLRPYPRKHHNHY